MNSVIASSPGKLILFGEHAVVYGYPCIGTAVDKRVKVTVEKTTKQDSFMMQGIKKSVFVENAVDLFRKRYKTPFVFIKTESNFTDKVGLGSSSAVTVSTIAALCTLFNIKLTHKELFDICYEVILSVQEVGSGFDIAAAIWGGIIFFKKAGEKVQPLSVPTLPLIIGYSGTKANTASIIKKVAEEYHKDPKLGQIFSEIGDLVQQAKEEIEKGDFKKLGKLMTQNHILLQKLGVSIDTLDQMVGAAIFAGAWGAKLSGAGGGDCIIALADKKYRIQVERAIEKAGGEIIHCKINTKGVEIL